MFAPLVLLEADSTPLRGTAACDVDGLPAAGGYKVT
jgi:hypothetical protein